MILLESFIQNYPTYLMSHSVYGRKLFDRSLRAETLLNLHLIYEDC